jgi:hypothetical protein
LDQRLASTDAQGRFEIGTLPIGPRLIAFVKAKGHGQGRQDLLDEAGTNLVEMPPFVLKVADQRLAGQVLGPDEKPVVGANLNLSREDQPEGSTTTDREGRFNFKVCEGMVQLFAHSQSGYANASAEAGETNLAIQLSRADAGRSAGAKPPSLKGRPLPDLSGLGFPQGLCRRAGASCCACWMSSSVHPAGWRGC